MGMTDPIADMLTRIRNANAVRHKVVSVPASRLKRQIAEVLKREGFISGYDLIEDKKQGVLRIKLKYGPDGEKVITRIVRESTPGKREYRPVKELKPILGGTGISIISTPKGVLSDRECRKQNIGGEYLCTVW
jgi:small subunit ribosomal protein S8